MNTFNNFYILITPYSLKNSHRFGGDITYIAIKIGTGVKELSLLSSEDITPFSEKKRTFFSENNYYDKRLIARSVVTCDVGKVKSCLKMKMFSFFLLLIFFQFKGFA